MKKGNLQKIIEDGIKIKEILDVSIVNEHSGYYSEEILEWNQKCISHLKEILDSNVLLFQFTKSDQSLAGLKNPNGRMLSLFETPYAIKKEPADISTLLENKLDFLISIQDKGKKVFEKIDGVVYIFDYKHLTGKLTIDDNDPIQFDGQTALILSYFYIMNKNKTDHYKTYKDFNLYIKDFEDSKSVNSKIFAQTIRSINRTINKKYTDIQEIISLEKKMNDKNIVNAYKWSYK